MNRLFLGTVVTLLIFCLGSPAAMAQIVGIDFNTVGGPPPANWNWGGIAFNTYNNLMDETGTATSVNLVVTGAMTSWGTSVNATTIPNHTNDLGHINEIIFSTHPALIQFQFTGLTAGNSYSVWVFGLRDSLGGGALNQNVTIAGVGNTNFNQSGANGELVVNDTVGSNAVDLADYARTVVAAGDGSITITVSSNGEYWAVAGLAIEPASTMPASVPTLGQWGMIILSLFLCCFAIRHMKRQREKKSW